VTVRHSSCSASGTKLRAARRHQPQEELRHSGKEKKDGENDQVHHTLQHRRATCSKCQDTDEESQGKKDSFLGIEVEPEGFAEKKGDTGGGWDDCHAPSQQRNIAKKRSRISSAIAAPGR